jgi:hypothetical protein
MPGAPMVEKSDNTFDDGLPLTAREAWGALRALGRPVARLVGCRLWRRLRVGRCAMKNAEDTVSVAGVDCIVDDVSVAPADDGEHIHLTLTLTCELPTTQALDLAMKIIAAVARQQGLEE